jgi:hypothetical protein
MRKQVNTFGANQTSLSDQQISAHTLRRDAMHRTVKTALTLAQVMLCVSQAQSQSLTLKASVLDANSNETLPYATVFNRQQSTGTATNLDGYFELPHNRVGDTIFVSYLGYRNQIFTVSHNLPTTIYLSPHSALLDGHAFFLKHIDFRALVARITTPYSYVGMLHAIRFKTR